LLSYDLKRILYSKLSYLNKYFINQEIFLEESNERNSIFDNFVKISDLYEKIMERDGMQNSPISQVKVLDLWVNFIKNEDNHVGYNLTKHGFWEPEVTLWMVKNIEIGDNCLDIGGNYGYFTQLLSYLVGSKGSVFSFEPNVELFKLSKLSDYMNVLFFSKPNNVDINNVALSRAKETLYLEVDETNPGGAGVSKSQNSNSNHIVYSVQSDSLDRLNLYKKFDFFKMDIEGGEEDCFFGGIKTLLGCRVGVIELGDYHSPRFLEELRKYFVFYRIKDDLSEEVIDVDYIINIYSITNSHFANIVLRRNSYQN
jgi:FkbM family methyltransferase